MNKYLKNVIAIFFVVMLALLLFAYWLDINFGFGQTFLILAGGYGIYLNFKAIKNGQEQT